MTLPWRCWAISSGVHIGRQEGAEKAVGELLALVSDFPRRGRDLMKRVVCWDEHVEMLADGLRKAGLEGLN
jgi:hypothetical protein